MRRLFTVSFYLVGILAAQAQAPTLISLQPVRNARAAPRSGPVTLTFSQAITAASASGLRVYGSQVRGLRPGALSGGGTATLTFTPTQSFAPGERVSVSVPATLTNAAGTGASRQVYDFTAATGGSGKGFFLDTTEVAHTLSRDVLLGDLDNDGDLDLLTNSGLFGMYSHLNDGQGHFTAHFNNVVAQTPSGATLADVNRDGYLDLLAGDADNATVAISLSNGNGTFGFQNLAGQRVTVGTRPVSVTTGDVDGDGDLDFASANYTSGTVTVGFNSGVNNPVLFNSTSTVSVGQQPTTVQLADIDNDGDLDLLTSNSGSNSVSIRLNNGLGVFSGTGSVAVGAAPSDLALTDLDGDGDLDLLTTNATDGTVSMRLNNGAGTFGGSTTVALPPGSTPTGLCPGDVDADGDQDVVVAQGKGGQIITLLNAGTGSLMVQYSALELRPAPNLPIALGVTLGDVDGDGDLDLLTTDGYRGRVLLGRNGLAPPVGAPTLTSFSPAAGPVGTTGIRLAGTSLSSTTAVYFNGISAAFVVNSNSQLTATVPAGATTGPLSVATAGGSATSALPFIVTAGPVPPVLVTATVPAPNAVAVSPTATVQATFASPITPLSAPALRVFGSQRRGQQAGPVSGGGTTTLSLTPSPAFTPGERVQVSLPAALTGTTGGSVKPQVVSFLTATGGTGEGIYAAAGSTSVPARASKILRSADLDNDGDLDLISTSATYTTDVIELRFNNGSGTFVAGTATLPALAANPTEVTPADVDGDGDLDLLIAAGQPGSQAGARLEVWLNNGQGGFTPSLPLLGLTGVPFLMRCGDLDADGDLDVLFEEGSNQLVRVAFNNGTGNFTLSATSLPANTMAQELADLDNDGDLDLVALVYNIPPRLLTALNDGTGVFTAQPLLNTDLSGSLALAVADMTGDGLPDVVVASAPVSAGSTTVPGLLTIWPGVGNGQLGLRTQPVAIGNLPQMLRLADVNADGKLDALALAINGTTPQLTTWLGDGKGGLLLPDIQLVGSSNDNVPALETGDFDGDGDLDLALSSVTQGTLVVRFNQGRPAPTITSFTPGSGAVGTRVVFTGTNLASARQVTFGGVAASSVQVLSATQCAALVPAGAATGPVTVTTPNGTATSTATFTVVVPVPLLSRSPARHAASAPVGGEVRLHFSQTLPASAAGDLIVHSDLRQGRHLGTASGAGTTDRAFLPTLPFAPGERVQVSLPVAGGPAAGSPQSEVYEFTAAVGGPGRGNLRWGSTAAYAGGIAADLDEDGAPDLLISEYVNSQLRILFNDGQGKLGTRTAVLTASGVQNMQVADLNNDGHLDLLLSHYVTNRGQRQVNRLVWRAGTGQGTFGAAQPLHYLNGEGQQITATDLNGDGWLDVAAIIGGADSVLVTLNQGNGVFQRQPDVAAAPYTTTLRLADCNNDGLLDLFTVGYGANYVYRSLGVGNGSFVPLPQLPTPYQTTGLELGDLTGDGTLELLVGNSNILLVLQGDGQGGFTSLQNITLPVGGGTNHLRLADLDADGDLDVLTGSNYVKFGVQLLFNNGTGTLGGIVQAVANIVPYKVAIADFDLDGSLDVVIGGDSLQTNQGTKSGLFVHLNRPLPPTISSFTPASGPAGTAITLTGMGLGLTTTVTVGGVPVAFTVVSATQLTLTTNANTATGAIAVTTPYGTATSAGTFSVPVPAISSFTPSSGGVQRLVTLTGSYLAGATAVRFNGVLAPGFQVLSGTQLSVLVPTSATTGLISVTTPSGTATSGTAFTFAPQANGLAPGRNAQNVPVAANLTLDFSQPVSAANAAQLQVFGSLRRGRRTGTLTGAGTGQLTFDPAQDFAPGEQVSVSLPTALLGMQGPVSPKQVYQFRAATGGTGRGTFGGSLNTVFTNSIYKVQLGDMDGDGDLDEVASLSSSGGQLGVALNNGNGTFAAPLLTTGGNATAVRLADLDGDGDLDVVNGVAGIWLNNGAGVLTRYPQQVQLPGYNAVPVDIGDLDGDGDLDLLTGDGTLKVLVPLLNNGLGSFTAAPSQPINSYFEMLRLADLDGDGDLDALYLTAIIANSYQLGVCLNDGNGNFSGTYSLALANEPTAVQLGDMNGDGHLDVVVTDANFSNSITVPKQWGITVLQNDGAGHFAISGRRPLYADRAAADVLEIGDIDADGDLDAITAGYDYNVQPTAQVVRLFLNNGQGSLTPVTPLASPNYSPRMLALGDVDGDGDLDLAFDNVAANGLAIRLNGPTVPVPLGTAAANPLAALVTLHPNPAHQQVTLGLPAGLLLQAGSLTLLNSLGQAVHQQPLPAAPAGSHTMLALPNLPAGLYVVRLQVADNQVVIGRLLLE